MSIEQNINENIPAPPKLANSYTVDENIFSKAELNVTLENMKISLQTRDISRKLYETRRLINCKSLRLNF